MYLENGYAVLLFEDVKCKLDFYGAFLNQPHNQNVVIFECGAPQLPHSGNLKLPCKTPSDLMSLLEGIPTSKDPQIIDRVIDTLIVENLSAFYWELRSRPRIAEIRWYAELVQALEQLRHFYKINVVVTMWDKNFERGFNSRPVPLAGALLLDVSYTPGALFEPAEVILHHQHAGVSHVEKGSTETTATQHAAKRMKQ